MSEVPKDILAKHRLQVLQGVLFLIDNPGEPLPDQNAPKAMRDFEDRAIESLLADHTFYYQRDNKPASANTQNVNADCMRRQVKNMYDNAATSKDQKPLHVSSIDWLFLTGTEALKASYLNRCHYDKLTFSKTDLPTYRTDEDEDEDDVCSDSQNSSDDAEASEDEREDRDDAASGRYNGKYDNSAVLEQDRLAPRAEVQSTESSTTRALPTASTGDAGQPAESAAELQDQGTPKPKIRLFNSNPQVQDAVAGSVSADHERLQHSRETSGCATEPKRKRDAREDGAGAETGSKLGRLSRAASDITQSQNALHSTETYHATTTKAPTRKTPLEDATPNSHVRPPIELDTSVLTKELGKLNHDTLQTIEAVLNCISQNPFQYPTALDSEPPQRLLGLYERCWGNDWEAVRLRLTREYLFTAPQVAMSLVSAFLYDNVLNQEASLLNDLARLRSIASLSGSGEAICQFLQPKQCWSDLKASAHAVYTTKAHALLAQDDATIQDQLHKEAEMLATDLQSIIVPHFRALSWFARAYGESSGQPEQAWMEVLRSSITGIIQRCLHHRLRLHGTGCEYVYTWPNTGEGFDSRSMQPDRKPDDPNLCQPVLFTVFPGLEVTSPDGRDEKMYIKAVVKVKQIKQSSK